MPIHKFWEHLTSVPLYDRNSDLPVPIHTKSHQLPFQICLPHTKHFDHVCYKYETAYKLVVQFSKFPGIIHQSHPTSPHSQIPSSAAPASNMASLLLQPKKATVLAESCFSSENFFRRAVQKFCGYWLRLTHNTRVCNTRVCNPRSGKVGSSHCYLDRWQLHEIATFDEIGMTKNILNNWLHYRVILIRYLILYACEDHGTYYKFYFKNCLILIAH